MEGVISFLNGLYNRGLSAGFIIATLLFILGLVVFSGNGPSEDPGAASADRYALDSLQRELRTRDSSIKNISSQVEQLGYRAESAEKKVLDLERKKQQAEDQLRDSVMAMTSLRTQLIAAQERNTQLEVAYQSEKIARDMALMELKAHRLITGMAVLGALILVFGAVLYRRRGSVRPLNATAKEAAVYAINRKVS